MAASILVLTFISLLVVGLLFVAAGFAIWAQGPRSPVLHAIAMLLVFRGHLNLLALIRFLPNAGDVAVRLWPVFDITTVAATVAVLMLWNQHRVTARVVDRWLSGLILGALTLGVAVFLLPEIYWGTVDAAGPLVFLNGLKYAGYALVGFLLFRRFFAAPPHPGRAVWAWLGLAFVIEPAFWVVTDLLFVDVLAVAPSVIGPTLDHYGRLVAIVPIGFVMVLLFLEGRKNADAVVRRLCNRMLLILMMPAASTVLLVNAHVFGIVGPTMTAVLATVVLDSLWAIFMPIVAGTLVISRPHLVGQTLATIEGPRPASRERGQTVSRPQSGS